MVLGVSGLSLAAVALVARVDPSRHTLSPPCPFHWLTGAWCPACGATRATHALLNGNFGLAGRNNLLWILMIPASAYVYTAWAGAPFGLSIPIPRFTRRTKLALGVAVMLFTVLRNLPFGPLPTLAPR